MSPCTLHSGFARRTGTFVMNTDWTDRGLSEVMGRTELHRQIHGALPRQKMRMLSQPTGSTIGLIAANGLGPRRLCVEECPLDLETTCIRLITPAAARETTSLSVRQSRLCLKMPRLWSGPRHRP